MELGPIYLKYKKKKCEIKYNLFRNREKGLKELKALELITFPCKWQKK